MAHDDLARTLEAVANRIPVISLLTTELRRSSLLEAQSLVQLEGDVDRVVRLLQNVRPKEQEE